MWVMTRAQAGVIEAPGHRPELREPQHQPDLTTAWQALSAGGAARPCLRQRALACQEA